jgi:hypothetical protein
MTIYTFPVLLPGRNSSLHNMQYMYRVPSLKLKEKYFFFCALYRNFKNCYRHVTIIFSTVVVILEDSMQDLHFTRFLPGSSRGAVDPTCCAYEQDNIDADKNCDRAIEIWQFCIFTWKCT